jgi:uroporphyrin-III C-methyltransferase
VTRGGKVYLVGAGPGDPELLTLKAVRAIGAADVVLYDDLVNPEILVHAPPGARLVNVGKRGGCPSTSQAFIQRLMVRLARRGNVVVRLKGGDPFVFGRGGEEVLALRGAGIEHEVFPGITAGIGVPAALGLPVTHRGLTRGVALVTGHTREGTPPDWSALAASGLTLVVYMGVATLPALVVNLTSAGMDGSTPAAAIQDGTLPGERIVVSTLGALVADVRASGLGSPAIIVIGEVVGLCPLSQAAETARAAA